MHSTKPLYVRPLTEAERRALEDSLHSPEAFVLRRAQIVLAVHALVRTLGPRRVLSSTRGLERFACAWRTGPTCWRRDASPPTAPLRS